MLTKHTIVASAVAALAITMHLCAETIHVPGDYVTIQEAIDAADDGDEIVVAPGTYNEAINLLGKAIHLRSSDGAERTTIDGSGLESSVVTCASGEGTDTILQGFTISGGSGNPWWFNPDMFAGGGMYIEASSPTIRKCVFQDNAANRGAGMYVFEGDPIVENCLFENNSASSFGGGMYNYLSSPTIINSHFRQNVAGPASGAGGMLNSGRSQPTIIDCTFEDNQATHGGGMMNSGLSTPQIMNTLFLGNIANSRGGAMHNDFGNPLVQKSTFEGNSANTGGAVSNEDGSHAIFEKCVFQNNSAVVGPGGAIRNFSDFMMPKDGSLMIIGCVFRANTASSGGGISTSSGITTEIADSLFCENEPDHISGSWTDLGNNSLSIFACDETCYGRCGEQTPSGCWCDEGCWDRGDCCTDACNQCGTPCQDKVEVPQDVSSIQLAVFHVSEGGEIVVAPGTYNEQIVFYGKSLHLRSASGPEVTVLDGTGIEGTIVSFSGQSTFEGFTVANGEGRGIFAGGQSTVSDCIVEANGGIGMTVSGSSNVTNCVFRANELRGLTVSSDATIVDCVFENNSGGGMHIGGQPTVKNCVFTGNSAHVGGGITIDGGSPTVINCVFEGNTANSGGGMYTQGNGQPEIIESTFRANVGNSFGGGMSNRADAVIIDCLFEDNVAGSNGGAMWNFMSTPQIAGTLFCRSTPHHIHGDWSDLGDNILASLGDINCDGVVDVFDLLLLIGAWGPCEDPHDCPADLIGNGEVGVFDLQLLIFYWG